MKKTEDLGFGRLKQRQSHKEKVMKKTESHMRAMERN